MKSNYIKRADLKEAFRLPVRSGARKQCHFCFKKFEVTPTCQQRFCSEECKIAFKEARK